MAKLETPALQKVYGAKTQEELNDAYAAWANAYDRETAEDGYCLPFMISSWVARHVAKGEGPLLDAGCGTGLSGPYLKALGYDDLEGLDLSEEMLELAKQRGCYRALTNAALGEKLPWMDGHFRAAFCTGVFTAGHAPAEGLFELVRIVRQNGHLIFTVRDTILETGGFRSVFEQLENDGCWKAIEESDAFRAFAVGEPDVLVKAFVYKIL
ncbi:class I SAM-dependent methyltransferase [Mesorhizobium sp. SB112]|uniref:class I SAM-dependent DNA methyltransferase n=1 Tax=Mesorhizobium sp. SB112 TaxID=3151853 RepID=UPI0032644F15